MFEALLQSARATKIKKVAAADGYISNKPFSIFIAPTANGGREVGEVLIITAKPVRNEEATEVPVIVGDWSPVVFCEIAAGGIEAGLDVYIAEIEVS